METKNNFQQNEVISYFMKSTIDKQTERKKLEKVLWYTINQARNRDGKFTRAEMLMRSILVKQITELTRVIETNPAAQRVVLSHLKESATIN